MEKKVSDLEHSLIKKEIEKVSFKMHEGFLAIDKNITNHFELLRVKNDAEAEKRGGQLDNILVEQKKTNGKVKALQVVTSKLKFLQENKTLTLLLIYGAYNAADFTSIKNIFKFIGWIQSLI